VNNCDPLGRSGRSPHPCGLRSGLFYFSVFPVDIGEPASQGFYAEVKRKKEVKREQHVNDEKRGAMVVKQEVPDLVDGVKRSRWEVVMPPVFTQQPEFLKNLIPRLIA